MFLARTDEQRRFESALAEIRLATEEPGASQLLLLHGLGGMGKSELCRRFEAIARGQLESARHNSGKFLVIAINWQDERKNHAPSSTDANVIQPLDVFTVLYESVTTDEEVTGSRRLRKRSRKAFEGYLDLVSQAPELQAVGDPGVIESDPLGVAAETGLRAAGRVGEAALGLPVSPATEGAARIARAARQNRKGRISPTQVNSVLRPEESLTREFGRGLRDLSQVRPIVVILDTYEIVASAGGWIRRVIGSSGTRILWVVAARLEPESEAGASGELFSFRREIPEDRLRVIPMTRFGRETIAEELAQRGVPDATDGPTLEAVASLTRGVPLAVGIVAGMMAQGEALDEIGRTVTVKGDTSSLVRQLSERYLLHALGDPALRDDIPLLYGLALLYADRADPEVLRVLWDGVEDVVQIQDELAQRHDFVLTGSRRLHQEVRDTFRRYLLDTARRGELAASNLEASQIVLGRAERAVDNGSIEAQMDSEAWRTATATMLWYRFWVSNEAGLEVLCELLPAAILLQRGFANELLGLATFFEETFTEEQKRLHHGLTSLLSFGQSKTFLDGWISLRRRTLLSDEPEGDPAGGEEAADADRRLAIDALRQRACCAVTLSDQATLEAAVDLLIAKSDRRDRPREALASLQRAAAAIPPGDGSLPKLMVQAARDLGNSFSRAEDSADEGLQVAELWIRYEPNSPDAWAYLGWSRFRADMPAEALSAYRELTDRFGEESALETRRLVARSLISAGRAHEKLGEREEELRRYDEVISRYEDDDDHTLRRIVGEALFNRAIELSRGDEPAELARDALLELPKRFGDSDHPDLRSLVARALLRLGESSMREVDHEMAAQWFGQLARLLEQDTPGFDLAARMRAVFNTGYALKLIRGEEAVEWFDRAIALGDGDDDPAVKGVLARAHIQRYTVLMAGAGSGGPEALEVDAVAGELLDGLDPPYQSAIGDRALFLSEFLDEPDRAIVMLREAVETMDYPFNICMYSRLLFEQGQGGEAVEIADRALALPSLDDDMVLEINFYLSALGPPERRVESLAEVRRLLTAGARSPEWRLDKIVARAEMENHPDAEWLRLLARVINDEEELAALDGWMDLAFE